MSRTHVQEDLGCVYKRLRATKRGKHIGRFSYYHISLLIQCRGVRARLTAILGHLTRDSPDYNVVKLDRRARLSFLLYGDFAAPFPVLLAAVSCNLDTGTIRQTTYAKSSNPPILHRKELLLGADDPLVPDAVRLTASLERHGAFQDAQRIGTRKGWATRLETLGLSHLLRDHDGCSAAH